MPKASPDRSAAYQFVRFVWEHSPAAGRSWIVFNGALHTALKLAIEARFVFDVDDFRSIAADMRGGRWMGASTEHYFTVAVETGNDSACRSYEAWQGRGPFVFGGRRLHERAAIEWPDPKAPATMLRGTVSSIASDSFIFCTYDGQNGAPSRRVTVTLADLKAAEKGRVGANKEASERAKICERVRWEGAEIDHAVVDTWTKVQRADALAWLKLDRWARKGTVCAHLFAAAPALAKIVARS